MTDLVTLPPKWEQNRKVRAMQHTVMNPDEVLIAAHSLKLAAQFIAAALAVAIIYMLAAPHVETKRKKPFKD